MREPTTHELDLAEAISKWFRARYPERPLEVVLDWSSTDPTAPVTAELVAEEHGGTMFSSHQQPDFMTALVELFLDVPSNYADRP